MPTSTRRALAAGALIGALIGSGCAVAANTVRQTTPAPAPARAQCPGDVVTVADGEPTGCDVHPPQRLDVTGATPEGCDHMGGRYDAGTCRGVDY